MENLLIHKLSRFLPSSLSLCHVKNESDVVDNSTIFSSQNLHQTAPPNNNKDDIGFSPSIFDGIICPRVTPVSVVNSHLKWRAKPSKPSNSSNSSNGGWFSSDDELEDGEIHDDKSDTFFSLSSTSSRSFNRLKTAKTFSGRWDVKSSEISGPCSSDLSASSISTKQKTCNSIGKPPKKDRETAKNHRKTAKASVSDVQVEFDYYSDFSVSERRKTRKTGRKKRTASWRQREEGKTRMVRCEIGYAMEKSTNDPYNDFRTSMVEMIMEKQIFGAEGLQKLLQCFLSLNSSYFHHIIVEVFSEIIHTLFISQ